MIDELQKILDEINQLNTLAGILNESGHAELARTIHTTAKNLFQIYKNIHNLWIQSIS